LDADGNGQVSRREWRKSEQLFNSIDSDGGGTLTLEELTVYFGGAQKGSSRTGEQGQTPLAWIDVHVHPFIGYGSNPDAEGALAAAISAMDTNHIARMILMPAPMVNVSKSLGKVVRPVPFERWVDEARKHPSLFAVMGGGGSLNSMIHDESPDGRPSDELKRRFAERAEAIMEMGAVGFGEIAISHLSMVPGQQFMDVPADHPLLFLLADIAAKHDAVIDVHFDPVAADIPRPDYVQRDNPALLKRNLDYFERFLEHNRNARISWAHAGSDRLTFWTAEFTREFLQKHPNLYMSLRMIPSKSGLNHPLTDTGISQDWMQTFEQFPDRFFVGGDQFFLPPKLHDMSGPAAKFAAMSDDTCKRVNRFLTYLPPKIARMFAYENAMQVYKLSESERLGAR